MSHVSHKLKGSIEGALAGGGDPATSPLYVFGPFLRLLVAGGVASICFGASIWLAILTVVTVSAMYRLVMRWVTDGSGGSGLSEEEFGSWAVKVNASITVIEYTLTFLVSIAALVTFIADRFPALNHTLMGMPYRTLVAVVLSLATGLLVNLGPRVSARTFGPATAAVLALLWAMIIATIWKYGLVLPELQWKAFDADHIHLTLGGYARILALMTGIEIFANLVAAYEGPARARADKAFGSLVIIMGTTALTMLIVGPAILDSTDPMNREVSVFTQVMDVLLPAPLPYLGTLIGVAVLLSAAAASAQGIQNLFLGLRYRHYVPAWLGLRNRYGVAAKPVWLMAALCVFCFLAFGTHEETYLALYAAGVFVLLALTGWAAVKRLVRQRREASSVGVVAALGGTIVAAILTSIATLIIFEERFMEGAWMYLVLVPGLYFVFGYYRRNLQAPEKIEDRLGLVMSSSTLPQEWSRQYNAGIAFENILVPLDQSPSAELALAGAQTIARNYDGTIHLLSTLEPAPDPGEEAPMGHAFNVRKSAEEYLADVVADISVAGYKTRTEILEGKPAEVISSRANRGDIDLILMTTHGRSRMKQLMVSNVTTDVINQTTPPLIVIRPTEDWRSTRTTYKRLLVALDGSEIAEQVLPYVHELAFKFDSHVSLLSIAEGSESDDYVDTVSAYLQRIAGELTEKGVTVRCLTRSAAPAQMILSVAKEEKCDLIMMVSHGRGGIARKDHVKLGSVVDKVMQETSCPIFLISAQ